MSKFIWQYYLVVPAESVAAADAVAPGLNNPSGIEATFQRFPSTDEPATHWAASFLATELMSEGNPSRQALETYLGQNPDLESLLWVRCRNPHHPETPEDERGIVVASNWPSFPVGAAVDWAALWEALDNG